MINKYGPRSPSAARARALYNAGYRRDETGQLHTPEGRRVTKETYRSHVRQVMDKNDPCNLPEIKQIKHIEKFDEDYSFSPVKLYVTTAKEYPVEDFLHPVVFFFSWFENDGENAKDLHKEALNHLNSKLLHDQTVSEAVVRLVSQRFDSRELGVDAVEEFVTEIHGPYTSFSANPRCCYSDKSLIDQLHKEAREIDYKKELDALEKFMNLVPCLPDDMKGEIKAKQGDMPYVDPRLPAEPKVGDYLELRRFQKKNSSALKNYSQDFKKSSENHITEKTTRKIEGPVGEFLRVTGLADENNNIEEEIVRKIKNGPRGHVFEILRIAGYADENYHIEDEILRKIIENALRS